MYEYVPFFCGIEMRSKIWWNHQSGNNCCKHTKTYIENMHIKSHSFMAFAYFQPPFISCVQLKCLDWESRSNALISLHYYNRIKTLFGFCCRHIFSFLMPFRLPQSVEYFYDNLFGNYLSHFKPKFASDQVYYIKNDRRNERKGKERMKMMRMTSLLNDIGFWPMCHIACSRQIIGTMELCMQNDASPWTHASRDDKMPQRTWH